MLQTPPRDHGGGLDAAAARYGGARADWLDLSTGINPVPYPVAPVAAEAWTALPDRGAADRFEAAARAAWRVPAGAAVLAAPGASALIARMPGLAAARAGGARRVAIPGPTYNEHAAAFAAQGWTVTEDGPAPVRVAVHPNNPDGRLFDAAAAAAAALTVIDESFCDTCPDASRVAEAGPGVVILKSFGKFWGLAGLRLGAMIGTPEACAAMAEALGPWPVSGPALEIGARALGDADWAAATRARLARDAARLDALMAATGAPVGGTTLFRTYAVPDAAALQARLARARIWVRVFSYAPGWVRLGLPGTEAGWARLAAAL